MDYAKLPSPQTLTIKEALKWPEHEKPIRKPREVSGRWVSETKEEFSAYKDPAPAPAAPLLEISDNHLNAPPDLATKLPKPKPLRAKPKSQTDSRSLSDSKFAQVFHKPTFAQYGQGNSSISSKRLFGKGHMKTFNVVPVTENKHAVHFGAKAKSFTLKEREKLKKTEKTIDKKQEVVEKKQEGLNEVVCEVLDCVDNSENIKAENSTQCEGRLCKNCMEEFEEEYNGQRNKNVVVKDPRGFKGMDPRKTGLIPYAGKSKKKSDTAYQVIFGQ